VTATYRVIVGEDSLLAREGIINALHQNSRLQVVGAEPDYDGLRDAVERLAPDVVVTDIRMPPTETDEGIRLADELRTTHPAVAVVVLSQIANAGYATTLFKDRAANRAYILKDRIVEAAYLQEVIESVVQRRPVLDPTVFELVIGKQNRPRQGLDDLSPRELGVLQLIAAGRTNAAIGQELVITRRAVERHVNAIFSKLDLRESTAMNRRVLAALLYVRTHDPSAQ
jgi:DNA-binding NarL/FixJ family response regulator